jgi:hypothetical protein
VPAPSVADIDSDLAPGQTIDDFRRARAAAAKGRRLRAKWMRAGKFTA